MKNKKVMFRFFTVPEWQKEENFLREQHKKGWKFTRVTFPGIYHFVKCEPEDVIYQLDYNQDAQQDKGNYVKMFEDCGWEYLLDFVGYSYFRKPMQEMNEEENIFSDDESKIDMMRRVFRGRMVPLIILFCGVIVPQLLMQTLQRNSLGMVVFVLYLCIFAIYTYCFIRFGIGYYKQKKKLK